MPIVPQYERTVQARPIQQQGYSVQASPDDFGAAIGRGMGQLAQGVGSIGQAMQEVKALEDVTRVKERDNETAAKLREANYGEGGFMTLSGKDAVDGRKAYEEKVRSILADGGKDLTPGQQQMYKRASDARLNQILDQSIVHTANERKKWVNDTSDARLETFQQDAIAAFDNPKVVEKNIALAQAEVRQFADLNGWDADQIRKREAEIVSGMRKNVTVRIAQTDPAAARKYFEENKNSIIGKDQSELGTIFAPLIIEDEAKQKVSEWNDHVNANTFAAADLPQNAYALLGAIASSESPAYNVLNGGQRFNGYDDHPRVVGKGGASTAAGRYQFVKRTWDRVSGAIGASDFSPENQDRGAWWLAQQDYKQRTGRDLNDDIALGRYSEVRKGLSSTWEGLANMSDARFAAKMQKATGVKPNIDPQQFLDGIENPKLRDAVAARLQAQATTEAAAAKAANEALQMQIFQHVDQGGNPDDLTVDQKAQIGIDGMTKLWSYYDKKQERGGIKTDERTLYDLQTTYASDPDKFADVDLWQFRDRLNDKDWETVKGWRQTALTDKRKAMDDGIELTSAFNQAKPALAAIGVDETTGIHGDKDKEAAARYIAEFNNVLARRLDEFKSINKRNPTQIDVQQMINTLLVKGMITSGPVEKSAWDITKTPWSSMTEETRAARLFQAGAMADGETFKPSITIESIPVDLRRGLVMDLTRELGRAPSNAEVINRYILFRFGTQQ